MPHIGFGATHPRIVGYCLPSTHYGGRVQMTLNDGLVFGTNTQWVVRPWPAEGTRRFIEDLLLRLTLRQYVLEFLGMAEATYNDFGPLYAGEANRVGTQLELSPVACRSSRTTEPSLPLARFWPHNVWLVKDPNRYGDDVTDELLDLAAGTTSRRTPPSPSLAAWEMILLYHRLGRSDRLAAIAEEHVARLRSRQSSRLPAPRHRLEKGPQDTDGQPLGEVAFDPAWLTRHDGAVARIAAAIDAARVLSDLPMLAAALEEAGCTDGRILRHLRHPMEHTCSCWVLRGLLEMTQVES